MPLPSPSLTSLAALLAATVLAPALAVAAEDDILLTVTDSDGAVLARLDMEALQALPARVIETSTIWTDGIQVFTGVPLATLMQDLAPEAQSISATAINDYAVEIPRSGWADGAALLAYLNHGEPMSLREKGPLWIVFPFDADPAYRQEVVYARSIWQLDRISVTE